LLSGASGSGGGGVVEEEIAGVVRIFETVGIDVVCDSVVVVVGRGGRHDDRARGEPLATMRPVCVTMIAPGVPTVEPGTTAAERG